jgi:hypothetical protein
MNPEIAKTLVEQRREELSRTTAETRRNRNAGPSWLSRRLPRWHVTWTRTVLSPAGGPAIAGGGNPDRPRNGASSLVIIISAHR